VTQLGRTGVEVTALGYGSWELRGREGFGPEISEDDACQLLNVALDAGINLIDTSPDYGRAEELIGKALASRRDQFFLASKCGCPYKHPHDWLHPHDYSPANIRAGVELSLQRMKTDWIDLIQLHMNPSRSTLDQEDSLDALQQLQKEGKLRFIGISGELPHLSDQIEMGVFDVFQIPYSALQREHEQLISTAAATGAGTIIRGGVARGVPGPAELARQFRLVDFPEPMRTHVPLMLGQAAQKRAAWEHTETTLADLLDGMPRMEFLLRFTLSHPDVHTTIVGTANPNHLAANVSAAAKGPLPPDVYEETKRRLDRIEHLQRLPQ
jgi:aryl-alcohol dehydrogenase-like predicted oxidoreductase